MNTCNFLILALTYTAMAIFIGIALTALTTTTYVWFNHYFSKSKPQATMTK